jgi:hypothetical protein
MANLAIFAILLFFVNGAKLSIIKKDEFEPYLFLKIFHKYSSMKWIPDNICAEFEEIILKNYYLNLIECLKCIEDQGNWLFKILFWKVISNSAYRYLLNNVGAPLSPSTYISMIHDISGEIEDKLLTVYLNPKEKKKWFKAINIMIKMVKGALAKLESQSIRCPMEQKMIPTWSYLLKNLSYDYKNRSMDFNSLFWTLSSIRNIFKTDNPLTIDQNQFLRRLCCLLFFYIVAEYSGYGFEKFKDGTDHRVAHIIYLVREITDELPSPVNFIVNGDLILTNLFERLKALYGNNQREQFNSIRSLLDKSQRLLENYKFIYNLTKKPKSYSHLIYLIGINDEEDFKNLYDFWIIKSSSKLEKYLLFEVKNKLISND